MGWAKRMYTEAERIKAGKTGKSRGSRKGKGSNKAMGVIVYGDMHSPVWQHMLKKFHISLRFTVMRNGVHEAAKVIAAEMKARAPDSVQTRTREKWSKKIRDERASDATNLKRSIKARKMRVRPDSTTTASMAGPGRPWGNIANIIENGGNVKRWGSDAYDRQEPRPFLRPAADQTTAAQRKAMVKYVIKKWTEA